MRREMYIQQQAVDRPTVFLARMIVISLAAIVAVLTYGIGRSHVSSEIPVAVLTGSAAVMLLIGSVHAWRRHGWTAMIGHYLMEVGIALAALICISTGSGGGAALSVWIWLIVLLLRIYLNLLGRVRNPGILFIVGFAVLIFAGAAALKLPIATPENKPINWLDAVFTSTSAVCVTGLIVRDTATEFTRFGQFVILALIQLGGLGIVTYASFVVLLSGKALNLRILGTIGGALSQDQASPVAIRSLLRFIGLATLIIELVGAALLIPMWDGTLPIGERVGNSVFMSVSAFCNAGFAVLSDSLVRFRWHWASHAVIAPLIVLGGLGFPVLMNLFEVLKVRLLRFSPKKQSINESLPARLSLHTKVVLLTTLTLYVLGTAGVLIAQGIGDNNSENKTQPLVQQQYDSIEKFTSDLNDKTSRLSPGQRFLDASFISVTSRTAGFNTMPMDEMAPGTRFVTDLLMFVGGSPGSTAGGIKTVTLAILVFVVWSTLRNRPHPEAFRRRIPANNVYRSATIILMGFLTISLVIVALRLTEGQSAASFTFEAVSACSTVGLSLDVTPHLSSAGRIVIIVGMFAGRLGPLTLLTALLFRAESSARYEYPEEGMIVG